MEEIFYNTKIQLGSRQAYNLVDKLNLTDETRTFVLKLVQLPVNTEVIAAKKWGATVPREVGSVSFKFQHMNHTHVFTIARDEDSVPKDVAYIFLHSASFSQFMYKLKEKYLFIPADYRL